MPFRDPFGVTFDPTAFDIRYDPDAGGYIPLGGGGGDTTPPPVSDPVTGGTTPANTDLRDQLGIPAWAWAIQPTYLWSFDEGTGLWTNPHTRKQYTADGALVGEIPNDPKHPENNIPRPGGTVVEGGLGPEGTLPPGAPDPGDGPVPNQLPAQISPNWDRGTGNFIGLPPPTGSSTGGGGGMANPMPGMPTAGVRGVPPHLAVSRASGTPVGQQEAFKPWGQPLGYLSQALRYGGTPSLSQQGGYAGMEALAAALRGDS